MEQLGVVAGQARSPASPMENRKQSIESVNRSVTNLKERDKGLSENQGFKHTGVHQGPSLLGFSS